jgi:hypothetical protein
VFIPADAIAAVRLDSGVAGTVKAKDSVIVITWRLGDATVDTGFRADDSAGHANVLNGLARLGYLEGSPGASVDSEETGEPRHA